MVKKHILFLLLISLSGGYGLAQQPSNPQLLFEEATQHLQQGNIRQALSGYRQLEQQNQISGALFLNIALSYTRVDSMGKAKYYFLKAKRFEETEDRAKQALEYVENQFSRQSAVLPILPWQRALNWLGENIGVTVLLAIGLLLINVGVFLYILPWFSRSGGTFLSRTAIGIATGGLLIILLSFFIDYRQQRYPKAVMVTSEVAVREQPAPEAAMVNRAFEGYTFTVDQYKSEEQKGWSYIRMSNGQYGWIPSKEIMIL